MYNIYIYIYIYIYYVLYIYIYISADPFSDRACWTSTCHPETLHPLHRAAIHHVTLPPYHHYVTIPLHYQQTPNHTYLLACLLTQLLTYIHSYIHASMLTGPGKPVPRDFSIGFPMLTGRWILGMGDFSIDFPMLRRSVRFSLGRAVCTNWCGFPPLRGGQTSDQ